MELKSVTAAPASYAPRWGEEMAENGREDHEGHTLLNVLMCCTGFTSQS